MSSSGNNHNNGNCNGNENSSLSRHICEFVGETVTIFTTSGGASGCGFTGVILSVNQCFVRLVTDQGLAPSNPLAENICGEFEDGPCRGDRGGGDNGGMGSNGRRYKHIRTLGSVCDIPIDRIAAFCHNAV